MENTTNLRAGAGKAKVIFSPEMFPTDGFMGVHDDPSIRVLLLESTERFAIVEAELVMVAKPFVEDIKHSVCELCGTPEDNIWVHCNHVISTPHAPGPKQKGPPDKRPPMSEEDRKKREIFTEAVRKATREAARMAAETIQPASFGVGAGQCDVNASCRQLEVEHGLRKANETVSVVNKTMTVLRFDSLAKQPIGFLICYDVKPCALDNAELRCGTRLVSADVPGKACAVAEEMLGVPVLYCMGATGDQHPKEQAIYDIADKEGRNVTIDMGVEYGLKLVEKYGRVMGNDAVTIANSIKTVEGASDIKLTSSAFEWESMPDPKKPAPAETEMSRVPVLAMRIGGVAFVATNPEISCATERQIRDTSPFAHTLLISMVNGPMKYMPDRASFEQNTREAQNAFAKLGAAEKFAEVASELLQKIL